jgi:hypothetical protein
MKEPDQKAFIDFTFEEALPESCSRVCQCSDLPARCAKHAGPCSIEISHAKNHTHVLIAKAFNVDPDKENLERKRLCVSPKCIAPQESESFERIPERDCLVCYNKSLKIEPPAEEESRVLLHSWRINQPGSITWSFRNFSQGAFI